MGGYPGFGLFLTTLSGQSSVEQLGWWLEKCYKMKITGAYAQTELGHGSNVRGLRTTATYDASTEEFVLDTPTLPSMKWWPSSMATATHSVVYAQLLINGAEYVPAVGPAWIVSTPPSPSA
jgi:acyl-CoA oxidase